MWRVHIHMLFHPLEVIDVMCVCVTNFTACGMLSVLVLKVLQLEAHCIMAMVLLPSTIIHHVRIQPRQCVPASTRI